MPSAEELAASLEAGESYDDQYMAGHGGWSSFYPNFRLFFIKNTHFAIHKLKLIQVKTEPKLKVAKNKQLMLIHHAKLFRLLSMVKTPERNNCPLAPPHAKKIKIIQL